ncbi:MAG: glycosyltransferase family 2 protein [Pirellulales bacterium]
MPAAPTTQSTDAVDQAVVKASGTWRWNDYYLELVAREISTISRHCDGVVQFRPLGIDSGHLLERIECPQKRVAAIVDQDSNPFAEAARRLVVLNGNLNHTPDVQAFLAELRTEVRRRDRVAAVLYNPYLHWLYRFANRVGVRRGELPRTFLTRADVDNVARLAGFEVVRVRPVVHCPFRLAGLGTLVNWLLPAVALLRWMSLATVVVLRPIAAAEHRPSLSVVMPARNERDNIELAVRRLEKLAVPRLQLLLVEGGSSDGTWDEVERVARRANGRVSVRSLQQPGRGKADAVRFGFSQATGDLVAVWDADLAVEPELLQRFYNAYCQGLGDFVNGNRLVYPMEHGAMRFLNRLANGLLGRMLSYVLDEPRLRDALCGAKLFARCDWPRMAAWQAEYGGHDPFGDFDLLSAAAVLGLGIVEVPVPYRARVYGATNIRRFRDGWQLARLLVRGLLRIRMGRT